MRRDSGLADPGDPWGMIPEAEVAEAQGDDLRRAHPGETETEHQLVAETDLPVAPQVESNCPKASS